MNTLVNFVINRNFNPDGLIYKIIFWLDVRFGGPIDISWNYREQQKRK